MQEIWCLSSLIYLNGNLVNLDRIHREFEKFLMISSNSIN